jgi:dihydrofolate reductase
MQIAIIAAMDRRGLIGHDGKLPWHLPQDLRRFRQYTWRKPIIMGRKTFESIGKPLPERFNIVLTTNPDYNAAGCQVARSYQEALSVAENCLANVGGNEVVIIGGGTVYAEAIHRWDRLYLTIVEGQFQGTVYFPICELLRQRWRPASEPAVFPADEKNPHGHSFHVIERVWDAAPISPPLEGHNLTPECADPGKVMQGLDLAAILARGTMDL